MLFYKASTIDNVVWDVFYKGIDARTKTFRKKRDKKFPLQRDKI